VQKPYTRLALLAFLFCCWLTPGLLPTAHAQQLGVYTFTGVTTCINPNVDAGFNSNVTFSVFSQGGGLTCPGTYGNGHYNRSGADGNNLTANDYFSFTITPNSGITLNLTSLSFYARRSGTGAPRWAIRTSLDAFSQNYTEGYITVASTDTLINLNLQPTFANQTAAVTFHIYMWNASSALGTFRVDSVSLNGTAILACAPNATVQSQDVTGCFGNANGGIAITGATGGSGQYDYSINGGATWQPGNGTFPNLPAGTYNVQIRDAQSTACVRVLNSALAIGQPSELNATATPINATCAGRPTGSIQFSGVSGGSGQYEYSLDGNTYQTGTTFSNILAGSYQAWVRDRLNPSCEVLVDPSVEVLQPDSVTATLTYQPINCFGGTALINITNPFGGSGLYDYSIDSGATWQTSGSYPGLQPGTYNVLIRDRAQPTCTFGLAQGLVAAAPAQLTAQLQPQSPTCPGGADGSIRFLNPSGGSSAFEFSIDGGTTWQTSPTFSNLAAGLTFNAQMRDANTPSCRVTLLAGGQLLAPDTLSASLVFNNALCANTTGLVELINLSGGSGQYEFSYDNGLSWSAAQTYNLPAGAYIFIVRDAAAPQCPTYTIPTMADILAPAQVDEPIVSDASRCGPGTVSLIATEPLGTTVNWYANDTTDTILFTGTNFTTPVLTGTTTYYLTANTATCASNRVAVTITINPLPTASFTANPTTVGAGGSVQFTYTGTAAPSLTWLLDGTSFSTASAPSQVFTTAGSYNVSVVAVDANGCRDTSAAQTIIVTPATAVAPDATFALTVAPNPAAHWVTLSAPALSGQAVAVTVTDLTGRTLLAHQTDAFAGALSLDVQHLPAALYLVRVESQGQAVTHKLLLAK